MKVEFLGNTGATTLINGKVYEVISVEQGWYRIIDEDQDDDDSDVPGYLYPPELFKIVED